MGLCNSPPGRSLSLASSIRPQEPDVLVQMTWKRFHRVWAKDSADMLNFTDVLRFVLRL